ncbi:RCC1 domain-containing protein [Paenibacillus phocaensis]|uniref:RCC1 domain-containing protein n=1 Tax=Paenibacillus phocaensis TaxID=1776378 RepID=UPI000839C616|nr:S-layer homology domain-containing protein [Paenibacillus phocaensis]
MRSFGKAVLCLMMAIQLASPIMQAKPAYADSGPDPAVAPKLVSGYYHTVSLTSSGEVWSWGRGDHGQLGNESTAYRYYPVKGKNLSDVVDIDAGVRGSIAIKQDGTVWTWGSNSNGQLGNGSTSNSSTPGQVPGLTGVTAVSGRLSYHSMALRQDGTVWTWGKNDDGELGDGTTMQQTLPVQVVGLEEVKAIAAGGYFSLALKNDGTVWAWGYNGTGELGDGTHTRRTTPVQVAGLSEVTAIAVGGSQAFAIREDGTVWAWGDNRYGALGDGTRTSRNTPVQVAIPAKVVAIAGGGYHSLALDDNGEVWSWGYNSQGQLGLEGISSTNTPLKVDGLHDVMQITAGGYSSHVMKKDGTVWGWGYNGYGELGDGTRQSKTVPVITKAVLDTTPPQITDGKLSINGITATEATVRWTKASDNLLASEALTYLLYVSEVGDLGTVSRIEKNGIPYGGFEPDKSTQLVTGLTEGTTYYFNVIVQDGAGNKSAYAMQSATTKWPAIYTLTYDGNGQTDGQAPVDPALYAPGDTALVLDGTGLSREGNVFAGWNTAPDGSGTDYPAGSFLTFDAENRVLYAKWMSIDEPTAPDTTLSSLSVYSESGAPVALTPAFSRDKFGYSAVVPHAAAAVTVTAEVYQSGATVTASVYDDAGASPRLTFGPVPLVPGEAGPALPLQTGSNRIELEVIAENGAPHKYTVMIQRKTAEDPNPPAEPPVTPEPLDREASSTAGGSAPPPSPNRPATTAVKVELGGQALEQAGTALVREMDGRRRIEVKLDTKQLTGLLGATAEPPVLAITLQQEADDVSVELPGSTIQALEDLGGWVEIRSTAGSIKLPAKEIGWRQAAAMNGQEPPANVAEGRLTMIVEIARNTAEALRKAEAAALEQRFELVQPPVDFRITASYDAGKIQLLDGFKSYVERNIPLDQGIAPSDITGAVAILDDGSFVPVAMRIGEAEGKFVAVLRSMAGGNLVLIRKPSAFADIPADHFAAQAVEDLAGRLMLGGFAGDTAPPAGEADNASEFRPNDRVTRAQLAVLLVRALGLGGGASKPEAAFADTVPGEWYADAAATAKQFGILQGYADGTFRPNEVVSRQEALAMLTRTLTLLHIEGDLNAAESGEVLAKFKDQDQLAEWAKPAALALLKLGILQGSASGLQPRNSLTRGESAVLVQRLLQEAGFID